MPYVLPEVDTFILLHAVFAGARANVDCLKIGYIVQDLLYHSFVTIGNDVKAECLPRATPF